MTKKTSYEANAYLSIKESDYALSDTTFIISNQ